MIHLDHRDRRPIYEQIAESLCQQIRAGVLQPGDQLPSVRELSASLSINPNTIQRAYRELERTGWTVSQPGRGSFVAPRSGPEEPEWAEFDRAARALLERGCTQAQLRARLEKIGGKDNA